ncbi:Hypothetical protein CINCED_3A001014 [Cinara cedri]|uniref:Uncharacterized protein n=1 Tax=Cinara cedri TaxID=506608 RepID=A0A5E4MPL4_9HEMI|nr:Hypothetical protein CINCED_3A001014 [Cinara cedri]
MRPDTWSTAFRVAFVTLMLTNAVYTSKKQKRQLFREHLLPYFGGKIPDSAFLADRLSLNMLNKEGISVPDGVLFETRPKESFYQSSRNDPELSNSIVKMVHTSDGRFVPSEGQHSETDNEVETTYKILLPENVQNYQLPKFRPIPEPLQLPVRPQLYENALPVTPVRGQFGAPFFSMPQETNELHVRRSTMRYCLTNT